MRSAVVKKVISIVIGFSISLFSHAGGNPEFVKFPATYKSEFTQYDTRNRGNGKQLAVLYANEIALNSVKSGKLDNGSKIIMDVYKVKVDEDGNKITNSSGLFEKGKFAAIAVMEKNIDWDSNFSAEDRAGNWGFAIYNTDGTVKENDLECATCHKPYEANDYMFSFQSLTNFTQK